MVDEDVEQDSEGPHLELRPLVRIALEHLGTAVLDGAVKQRERWISGRASAEKNEIIITICPPG